MFFTASTIISYIHYIIDTHHQSHLHVAHLHFELLEHVAVLQIWNALSVKLQIHSHSREIHKYLLHCIARVKVFIVHRECGLRLMDSSLAERE